MNKAKRKKLERNGWRIGSASEFLRLSTAKTVSPRRRAKKYQIEWARRSCPRRNLDRKPRYWAIPAGIPLTSPFKGVQLRLIGDARAFFIHQGDAYKNVHEWSSHEFMARPIEDLNKELLTLPRRERADLALRLIRSLDEGAEEDVDAYWKEELVRRSRQIEAGEVELIPAEEVFRKAHERLAKNQKK